MTSSGAWPSLVDVPAKVGSLKEGGRSTSQRGFLHARARAGGKLKLASAAVAPDSRPELRRAPAMRALSLYREETRQSAAR